MLVICACGGPPPQLSYELDGCSQVFSDGSCALPQRGTIDLHLTTAPLAVVHVLVGWTAVGRGVADGEGRLRLALTLPDGRAGRQATRVIARSGARFTSRALPLRPRMDIPWLDDIKRQPPAPGAPHAHQRAALSAWLREHPAPPLHERARASFYMALWSFADQLPMTEVLARQEEALRLAREAGHVQDQAFLSREHLLLLVRNARPDLTAALRLRDENRAAIERVVSVRESLPVYLAQIALLSGDLRSALPLAREAVARTRARGLGRFRCAAEQIEAEVLTQIGDHKRADALFDRLLQEAARPGGECQRCEVLTDYAASRLWRWEELPPPPETAAALARQLAEVSADPGFAMCRRQSEVAYRDQLRAGAALFRGDPDEAQRALEASLAAFPVSRQTPMRRLEWYELSARRARYAGDLTAARAHAEDEARVAAAFALAPFRHRAALQLALIEEAAGQTEAAGRRFREAEAVLEDPALRLPPCVLAQGGRHADPRCTAEAQQQPPADEAAAQPCAPAGLRPALQERGTAAYLDWLLRQPGQASEAVAVVRRARQRQQQALHLQRNLDRLSAQQLERFRARLDAYQRLRLRLEDDVRRNGELPGDELDRALQGQQAMREQISRELQAALAILDDQPLPAPRPLVLGAREAALLCHPLPQGYGCWTVGPSGGKPGGGVGALGFRADLSALRDLRASEPSARATALAAVSRALAPACPVLRPLAGAGPAAGRLRLIPYGALRELDLAAVPWPCDSGAAAAPTGERLQVVYSLDAGTAEGGRALGSGLAETAAARRAVLVFDPTENLRQARAMAPALCERLGGAGFALRPFGHLGTAGCGPAAAAPAPATSDAVLREIAGAGVFHFDGHAAAAGWQSALQLDQCTRILPGDILALPAAPRLVVLLGCGTGRAGGHRLEDMAMAQAFISAGSRAVIATARDIRDEDAAWLARRLYQPDPGDPRPAVVVDPVAALREAQRALRAERPTSDWSAFRVYVP